MLIALFVLRGPDTFITGDSSQSRVQKRTLAYTLTALFALLGTDICITGDRNQSGETKDCAINQL